MEDLFQIIIIIIFILSSIISSLNNKKKQQKKNKSSDMPNQRDGKTTQPKKKQKTSAEILEEILGLKVELPEPPKKEAPKSYSEDSVESWDPSNDFKDYLEEKEIRSTKQKEDYKAQDSTYDKNKFRAFKEDKPQRKIKKRSTKIQKLFADQNKLKNFIIIQEVLNKPKALRR